MTIRLGVLVSGRGTNLQAIIDAIDEDRIDGVVELVISNRAGVAAIERCRQAGVPVEVLTRELFDSRLEQQRAMAELFDHAGVELIVCAGFDQVLGPEFIQRFERRIINIHPSLLPAFARTLHAHEEAIAHGVKLSGCTVHFVTNDVDAGPIIAQRAVTVRDDDTPESLAARVLPHEHELLCDAIQRLAEGRLVIQGRRVFTLAPESV